MLMMVLRKSIKLIKKATYVECIKIYSNLIRKIDSKTKYRFRKFIILDLRYPGLGDSLMFSTLPEEFWKQFGKYTKLSRNTKFRNMEIYDLVWTHNPYYRGLTKSKPNSGHLKSGVIPNLLKQENAIRNVEKMHGLKPYNKYPKIYYKPQYRNNFDGKVLCDLSSITLRPEKNNIESSSTYNIQLLEEKFLQLLPKFNIHDLIQVKFINQHSVLENQNIINVQELVKVELESIFIKDIYHYCDLIFSAKSLVCLYSGQAALGSAINSLGASIEIYCLIPRFAYELELRRSGYLFDNINFVVF